MPSKFTLNKRILSFKFAFKGIKHLLIRQHNAWIHLIFTVLVIIAGFIFGIKQIEWLLICFAIGFVFTAEAMNTATELMVDKISPEQDKQAGLIKDLAAGAVLISAITAAAIGLIIFIPKIF
ncbi:MAG: diacylglycerol kinase family protein [Bacteroidales bacterium]|nr:diacylglycerol kinase family protein [Bacteroidales bacterium]MCF8386869.1 diacylglycerol kinase family protein [Bacteroidales bacterium]MCF8396556.1 diacylglycerol kinase family protein [Bacteroidales bacterium]